MKLIKEADSPKKKGKHQFQINNRKKRMINNQMYYQCPNCNFWRFPELFRDGRAICRFCKQIGQHIHECTHSRALNATFKIVKK